MPYVVTYDEADAMMSGSETEDLDVELLVAARTGDIEAIAAVCGHYRGRLMILARNAGAAEPEVVVQNALTETLLTVEAVEAPSLPEFERTLFDRVVVDSDPVPPRPGRPNHGGLSTGVSVEDAIDDVTEPALPVHPAQSAVASQDAEPLGGPVTADLWPDVQPASRLFDDEPWIDDPPLGAPVAGLAALTSPGAGQMAGGAEPSLFGSVSTAEVAVADPPQIDVVPVETTTPVAGGALLNPHTGPVDWSTSLAGQEFPTEPVLVAPSKRLLAGAAAVVCGIGLLAAIALFFGGDDSTDEPQLAALVPPNGDQPPAAGGSSSGPESASGVGRDQNRSSGAVTGNGEVSGSSTTAQQPESTAAPSSTASTTATTSPSSTTTSIAPSSTAPPTTAEPVTTTEVPTTTTQPETTTTERPTTTSGPRPGDFRGQSLDNRTFRNGDFRDHDFSDTRLNNVDFRGADLRGVSFDGAVLTNVQFSEVDLTNASFRGADMDSTFFDRRSNISGVDFRNSTLKNGRISGFFFGDNEPRSWPDGEFEFGDD